MRDGEGNKLSPEEEKKVRSIQETPGKASLNKVSINPDPARTAPPPEGEKFGAKPAPGVGE